MRAARKIDRYLTLAIHLISGPVVTQYKTSSSNTGNHTIWLCTYITISYMILAHFVWTGGKLSQEKVYFVFPLSAFKFSAVYVLRCLEWGCYGTTTLLFLVFELQTRAATFNGWSCLCLRVCQMNTEVWELNLILQLYNLSFVLRSLFP